MHPMQKPEGARIRIDSSESLDTETKPRSSGRALSTLKTLSHLSYSTSPFLCTVWFAQKGFYWIKYRTSLQAKMAFGELIESRAEA